MTSICACVTIATSPTGLTRAGFQASAAPVQSKKESDVPPKSPAGHDSTAVRQAQDSSEVGLVSLTLAAVSI